jgi:alpha-L-arabinofuranosidase
MYAQNRGDRVLPLSLGQLSAEEARRLYAAAAFDATKGEVILKLVNATGVVSTLPVDLAGVHELRAGSMTILQGDLNDENTMDSPDRVAPYTTVFSPTSPRFTVELPAHSFSVVRVGVAP